MEIDLSEAPSKLYELGVLAWAGQEIVITRQGKPYLLLVTQNEDSEPGSLAETNAEPSDKGLGLPE